jgi:hypothetical protein
MMNSSKSIITCVELTQDLTTTSQVWQRTACASCPLFERKPQYRKDALYCLSSIDEVLP